LEFSNTYEGSALRHFNTFHIYPPPYCSAKNNGNSANSREEINMRPFQILSNLLDALINITEELLGWTTSLTEESKAARQKLDADRAERYKSLPAPKAAE
jgi:hypothetical protein